MYSKQLNDFIKENRPAEQLLTYEEVQRAAKAADLVFITDVGKHPHFQMRSGLLYAVLSKWGPETEEIVVSRGLFMEERKPFPRYAGQIFDKPAKVIWYEKIVDGKLVYQPSLSGAVSSSGRIEPGFFKGLGINNIEVELPERIVNMPVPEWAWSYDSDGNGFVCDANTTMMFASEAKVLIEKFMGVLQATL
ncbi:hypothetical protein KBA63_01680 [Candidatus Woesebacteria bacterium]|nr:hypothetical protein [Candidatus Woesebacteria bacterium]